MTRVSSRMTFVQKRLFPIVWFGGLAFVFLAGVVGVVSGQGVPVPILAVPIGMAIFGYLLMKHLVLDLADEVWDADFELVVRNAGREVRVPLRDIVNVSYVVLTNPQRVTLTLRQANALGKEIAFAAPASWIPFAKSPRIEALIDRIVAARDGRRD